MNAPCLFLQRLGVEDLRIPGPVTMREIAADVASCSGLTIEELRGPDRSRHIAWPRQEAMALCCATGRWSTTVIGRYFGGRDHSTVIHARREIAKRQAAAMAVAP